MLLIYQGSSKGYYESFFPKRSGFFEGWEYSSVIHNFPLIYNEKYLRTEPVLEGVLLTSVNLSSDWNKMFEKVLGHGLKRIVWKVDGSCHAASISYFSSKNIYK